MLKHLQSFLHGGVTIDLCLGVPSNCSCVTNVTMVTSHDGAHY